MNEIQAAAALSTRRDVRRGRGRTELDAASILSGASREPVTPTPTGGQPPVPVLLRTEAGRPSGERRAELAGV